MTNMNKSSNEKSASVTAQVSNDAMGLGRTSGQRTAEMVAGLRYELNKTDLNMALSRFAGRLVARMIITLLRDKSQINYILARPASFKQLTQQYVSSLMNKVTLVEIAAGFSPRGIEFAREMQQVTVIEIDLPDVVEEKQRRLEKEARVDVPVNIKWYGADLGTESLADVLGGEKVDIVSAEGLNPYFTHEDITSIARHVRESLKPGGVYISDVGWDETRRASDQTSLSMFSRQASSFLGVIKSEEEGIQLFTNAGYTNIEVYRPSVLTTEMPDIPTTPLDYSIIFLAHNPVDTVGESQPDTKNASDPVEIAPKNTSDPVETTDTDTQDTASSQDDEAQKPTTDT